MVPAGSPIKGSPANFADLKVFPFYPLSLDPVPVAIVESNGNLASGQTLLDNRIFRVIVVLHALIGFKRK